MGDTVFGYTERQFILTTGRVYSVFGQHDRAERHFDQVLPMYNEDEYVDPTLVQLDRARHMIASGAATDGCRYAQSPSQRCPTNFVAG